MSQKDSNETHSSKSTDSSSPSVVEMENISPPEPANAPQDENGPSMEEMMAQFEELPHGEPAPKAPKAGAGKTKSKPKAKDDNANDNSFDSNTRLPQIGATTLSRIPESRRPDPSTVCEHCPASMWLASPEEVKCYCRIMHLISWSTKEPVQMTDCDGIAIASAAAAS